MFPQFRPRRLRANKEIRSLVAENKVSVDNLMHPLFVVPGSNIKKEISALPGQYQLSVDKLVDEVKELYDLGIKSTMLFGIPEYKDSEGSSAWQSDGIIQKATTAIKESGSSMYVVADLCFCEYTDHGHCGPLCKCGNAPEDITVDNDKTLHNLGLQAVSLANAGIDMIAPSGNIDGMVASIRTSLDEEGFSHIPIMSYSAKYSSSFYGPFRVAVESAPSMGDRSTYQMNCTNVREALREVEEDIIEGADIVMVKPALSYLDVIAKVKEFSSVPVAAYNVSGEYSMIKHAAKVGLIDEKRAMLEVLTSIKRAGADIIITYFAKDFAKDRCNLL